MKKLSLVIVLIVVAVGGAYYFGFNRNQDDNQLELEDSIREADDTVEDTTVDDVADSVVAEEVTPTPSVSASPKVKTSPSPSPSNTVVAPNPVKEFTVIGTTFSFSLKEIKVNKGDRVRIVFRNEAGFHDWVVDEFNAGTKQIQAGQTDTIEFVADKTGNFEYYCSVGSHRQMGMVGQLIVQ